MKGSIKERASMRAQEYVARNVCLSGAVQKELYISGWQRLKSLETGGSKGPDCQSTDVSPKVHMACIISGSVGKVVALGDAIKSVSTRYSSNKVQDLKIVEDKIKTIKQTLGTGSSSHNSINSHNTTQLMQHVGSIPTS